MRSILILTDSINVQDSSGSKANVSIIKNLVREGFNVTVLHYTRREIKIPGANTVAIPELKFNVNYIMSRTQRLIQRHTRLILSKKLQKYFGFSFTFFNDSKSMAKALGKINVQDFDLLITLSKGESFRPHHAVLRLPQWHQKWLAYVHDPYPFNNYPQPYGFDPAGKEQQEAFFEQVAQQCKWAAFPSLLLKEWMSGPFPAFESKSIIIPHQFALAENKAGALPPDFMNPKKFNLLHAGNLIGGRSPEFLLKGFHLFLKNTPQAIEDSNLFLLGPHSFYAKMLQDYSEMMQNLVITGFIPFEQALAAQRQASVNLILEGEGESSPFLPGKFPNCVEADRPILALTPKTSEIIRLLGGDYLFSCTPSEGEGIAELIGELYHSWKKDPVGFRLNRPDLRYYVSSKYLKEQLQSLNP